MSIPAPSGSRLSGSSVTLTDVTGTEDVTVWTGRTTPTQGAVPVIYCHGVLGTGLDSTWRDETRAADDFRPICAWGHPVFVPNVGGPSTWGNQTAVDAITSVVTWASGGSVYGTRTDKVAVAGESMGALAALNWAIQNPSKVAALWLRVPCLGLQWTHDNVGTFSGLIDAAYGGTVSEAEYDTYDPLRNTDTVRQFRNRARIWAAASDEYFPLSVTSVFAGQLGIDLEVIGGTHANGYDTPPYAVAQWLDHTIRS